MGSLLTLAAERPEDRLVDEALFRCVCAHAYL